MRYVTDDPNVLAFPQAPEAIELRHLRAFVAVAEELNFGRAAERLYITQPALSRQIRALEALLGCELLRRSTHRVELTLAGEALLGRVRRSCARSTRPYRPFNRSAASWSGACTGSGSRSSRRPPRTPTSQEQRTAYEKMLANFSLPPEVTVRAVTADGVSSLVVGQQPDEPPRRAAPPRRRLRHRLGIRVPAAGRRPRARGGHRRARPRLSPRPEHPFPAAIEDAVCAYSWMLDRGIGPDEVTLSGDSSGGGLVMSLLLTLKRAGCPNPAAPC